VGEGERVVAMDVSPGMLAAGSLLPAPPGAPIEWRQGDAVDPDLPDGSFDLVTCQHGLQFFGDRGRALRHVHRMLRPRGRVALSVWQGMDRHPAYEELAELELRHLESLGVTEDDLRAPFSLGREELGALLDEAGFLGLRIEERSIQARFPDPPTFLRNMELAYAAVIPGFVEDPSAFEVFVRAVEEDGAELVRRHVADGMVVLPMHMWLAVGSVQG